MVNEAGRHIMQGGQRRSAIWAGLLWNHPDINKFITLKNHSADLMAMKEKDFNFHLPVELTNISVNYDTNFFIAIETPSHPEHEKAKAIWLANCKQAFSTAEPGMAFNFRKDNESLRNACVTGETTVLTKSGYEPIVNLVDQEIEIWNGFEWSTVTPKVTGKDQEIITVSFNNGRTLTCTKYHKFHISTNYQGGTDIIEAKDLLPGMKLIKHDLPIIAGDKNLKDAYTMGFVTVTDITESGIAETVYCFNEPKRHLGLFNGVLTGQCTEVTSEDDSDKCNLGTVWMNRCKDAKEFANVVKYATQFLVCGGIYSHVPTERIREVGWKNNRIGLGLGGIHEWLMVRGYEYNVVPELHKWLALYRDESDSAAFITARQLNVSVPKGVRAIAPNGTIGIIAETTTGVEPLFCKAYRRRYFKSGKWLSQFVVDGAVKRLLEQGVKLENIQDTYDLTFKQRVKFQADVQNYVDMAISSTCNMAPWGSETNNESTVETNASTLLKYAKRLRGFTVYPDGCRGGQPLTPIKLEDALAAEGQVFEENVTECIGGVCGI
jgi:ribonucleotide reductase alpha subunit